MEFEEAKRIVQNTLRENWLRKHGVTEKQICRDGIGEYICEKGKPDTHIEIEHRIYLPDNLQRS